MSRVRTFLAVDLGKPLRERLVALQQALGRAGVEVKWVEPDNLHLTLLFLGEVGMEALPAVCAAAAKGAGRQPAFTLGLQGAGCFPNPRRPRVLWAGVGPGTPEVCALHDALEEELLETGGYRREERPFAPHVTLGRVKSDRPADRLAAALLKQADWQGGQTAVPEVHVMGSELTPQGPRYTVLSRAPLAGS